MGEPSPRRKWREGCTTNSSSSRCPHTDVRSGSKPDAGSTLAMVHLTFLPCQSAGSNISKCCQFPDVLTLFPCPAPTLTAVLLAEFLATGTAVSALVPSVTVAVTGSPDEAVGVTGADVPPPSPAEGVLAMCCATAVYVLCFCVFVFFRSRAFRGCRGRTPYPRYSLIFCHTHTLPVRKYAVNGLGVVVLCTMGWCSPQFSKRGDGETTLQKLWW